jgi:hypothetical protein
MSGFRWNFPKGGVGWLAGFYMLVGIVSIYAYLTGPESLYTKIGIAFLIVGIGLWQRADWARWLAFGFNIFGLIVLTFSLYLAPEKFLTVRNGFKFLMVAGMLAILWEWDVEGEE